MVEIFSSDTSLETPAYFFNSYWTGRGQYDVTSTADVRLPARYVDRRNAGTYRFVDIIHSSEGRHL